MDDCPVLVSQLALATPNTSTGAKTTAVGSSSEKEKEGESQLVTRYYRALYAKLLSDNICTKTRNSLFLNLLFKSMKRDKSVPRVLSFIKRLLVITTQSTPTISAGILMLLSELCSARKDLKDAMFIDRAAPTDESASSSSSNGNIDTQKKSNGKQEEGENGAYSQLGDFDMNVREPLFAKTQDIEHGSSFWESGLLRCHFHPSIRAFANCYVESPHKIDFDGDPTVEFSLSSCINRFAYKNPKKEKEDSASGKRKWRVVTEQPVNNPSFIEKDEEMVKPDLAFFHKFFGQQNKLRDENRRKKARKDKHAGDDEDDDEDSVASNHSNLDFDANEADVDKFADKLALDMIAASNGGAFGKAKFGDDDSEGEDVDMDDMSSEDGEDGDGSISKEDMSEEDVDISGEEGNSDDDDDDDLEGLINGGNDDGFDSDDDDDDEEEDQMGKKKKKRQKKNGGEVFADAADMEEEMDRILEAVRTQSAKEMEQHEQDQQHGEKGKAGSSSKRKGKGGKRK